MNENRFNGKGLIYAKYRPSYAAQWLDHLYREVGFGAESVIADIGSGTGILTKELLERGSIVYAVEPNSEMRSAAERNLGGNPRFHSIAAAAEHTGLPDRSVDFVTAAQAFHWFDRRAFLSECRRILRPGGKVVLVWNNRVYSEAVRENERINRQFCKGFTGFTDQFFSSGKDDLRDFFSGAYEKKVFQNDQFYDEEGFIGRNLSSSYAPKEGEENYKPYVAALKKLFVQYSRAQKLQMPLITQSYAGRVSQEGE